MLYLAISCVILAAALAVSIIVGAKERKFLIGLLASKDYMDYKLAEDGKSKHQYRTMISNRDNKERNGIEQ